MSKQFFILIESMIVIAIIGVLAAFALPTYRDCAISAKISEGVLAGSAVKSQVTEAFQSDGINGITAAGTVYNMTLQAKKQSAAE